ncbi:hypothetical protein [Corallococcus sp. 4LFB]|uniref:hypothetical protein n=1 Tax=Corallococcus sp. 4LFB TaxID=3383249 RepID=UPI003974DE16
MRIEEFSRKLERDVSLRDGGLMLGAPVAEDVLLSSERHLGVEFPAGVRLFYRAHNGLSVSTPALEIHPVEKLERRGELVRFARFSEGIEVAFRVDVRNEANEWTIVNAETGFVVTLTMASFWSNKVFAWLERGRRIWAPETH